MGALTIATHYKIPEVCIYFNHKLLRGNRTTKLDANSFDAFKSFNYPPLAEVGVDLVVHWDKIRMRPNKHEKFVARTITDSNVVFLRLFPGIPDDILRNFTREPIEGLVLQTFGTGNAPDNRPTFIKILKEATQRGVIIVNITQCEKGAVEGYYKTGTVLSEAGVINCADV